MKDVAALYAQTRARTEALAARLSPEDQQLQSMPDASPAKWHRAHTTWFFETFVLLPAGMAPVDARYGYLFNSYYDAVGPRHARARRGLLSRPTTAEIGAYRAAVDERMTRWFAAAGDDARARLLPVVELGIAHEEQHQELLLTDILHAFSQSPLRPAFLDRPDTGRSPRTGDVGPLRFVPFEGGLRHLGAPADGPFVFDNETPRHSHWLEPFELSDRLVTFGELEGSFRAAATARQSLWLAEGYDFVRANGIEAPLHCSFEDGALRVFCLTGERQPARDEPLVHVSYYEADAIARFLGARLPTEAEWEVAAAKAPVDGNFVDDEILHPMPAPAAPVPRARSPALRRRLGVDAIELRAVSRLPDGGRSPGRVQWQVHGEPAGAARRLVPHPAAPRARHLSQLLAPGHAVPDGGLSPRA